MSIDPKHKTDIITSLIVAGLISVGFWVVVFKLVSML